MHYATPLAATNAQAASIAKHMHLKQRRASLRAVRAGRGRDLKTVGKEGNTLCGAQASRQSHERNAEIADRLSDLRKKPDVLPRGMSKRNLLIMRGERCDSRNDGSGELVGRTREAVAIES